MRSGTELSQVLRLCLPTLKQRELPKTHDPTKQYVLLILFIGNFMCVSGL